MPDPIPPSRQLADSILIYFDGDRVLFRSPLHQGAEIQRRLNVNGVRDSEQFSPHLVVEICVPDGETWLAPDWATNRHMSSDGVVLQRVPDLSNRMNPPRVKAYVIYLPENVIFSLEHIAPDGQSRELAFSVVWKDGQLFHILHPRGTEPAPLPPADG